MGGAGELRHRWVLSSEKVSSGWYEIALDVAQKLWLTFP